MQFKKRGMFSGKKGQEILHEMTFTTTELTFLVLFGAMLLFFVWGVAKDTTFQKNFLARDIATTLDVIYSSPNDIVYVYPPTPFNFTRYTLGIAGERVKIGEKQAGGSEIVYWFADLSTSRLTQEKLEEITTVAINKTRGATPQIIPLLTHEG